MSDCFWAGKEISTDDAGIYIIWISSLWANNNCRNSRPTWQWSSSLPTTKSTRTSITSWSRPKMPWVKATTKWHSSTINTPTTSSKSFKPTSISSTKAHFPTTPQKNRRKLSRTLPRSISPAHTTRMERPRQLKEISNKVAPRKINSTINHR